MIGPSLSQGVSGFGLAVTPDKQNVIIAGGKTGSNSVSPNLYSLNCVGDLKKCQWTRLEGEMQITRKCFAMFLTVLPLRNPAAVPRNNTYNHISSKKGRKNEL